jgi:hypothetical protein
MMSFERRIKKQRRYNSSRALVSLSLFAGEMVCARDTWIVSFSAGVTFACWRAERKEENAHDKVRCLLTLWHTATGARTPAAA